MAITTLAQVKAFMHITDNNDDLMIQYLLNSVSDFIEKTYCDRVFASANYTEYYDGDGWKGELTVKQFPVTAVASLYDDQLRAYTSDTLVATTDYVWYAEGRILLDRLIFQKGFQNIKVTYTAGYAAGAIPNDLQLAAWRIIQEIYKDSNTSLNTSNNTDKPITIDSFLKPDVKTILNRYKRISTR